MPSEARRLEHRVGERDRLFFAALALLGAVGVSAGAVFFGHGGGARASGAPRCVSFDGAGVMGGGTWRFCGAHAATFCRTYAGADAHISSQCAKLES